VYIGNSPIEELNAIQCNEIGNAKNISVSKMMS
jgi:hypothetical protein